MAQLRFSWDADKAKTNEKKHKVSFEEAETVFHDENARIIHDPDHSDEEDRYVLLGLSAKFRVLVVSHCYRSNDTEIRIISARRATKSEREKYEELLP